MSRNEVKSLNDLAMAHGGQLTINPQTGLPEAGFLSSLLPMVAGAALTGFSGGAINPLTAGLIVGGGSYLMNPNKGLMGGLMAGLGAYGGAGLGAGLSNLATSEAGTTTANAATQAAEEAEKQAVSARNLEMANQEVGQKAAENSLVGRTDLTRAQMENALTPQNQLQALTPEQIQPIRDNAMTQSMAQAAPAPTGMDAMYQGAKSIVTDPTADKFKTLGGGSYMGLAQKGLMAATPALAEGLKPAGLNVATTQQKQQVVPHYRFSPGMVTPTPAAGAKGVENTYFNPSYTALSDQEAANLYPGYPAAKAAGGGLMGYAGGGTPYEPYQPISGNSNVTASPGPAPDASGQGVSNTAQNVGLGMMAMGQTPGIATGLAGVIGQAIADSQMSSMSNANAAMGAANAGGHSVTSDASGNVSVGPGPSSNGMGVATDGSDSAPSAPSGGDSSDARGGYLSRGHFDQRPRMAGGDARYNLGGYSDGGRLLRGPGDGVSDSIPAVIGKRQPARLADGEFVVPARIVSEIGNGSTEAGARKLYAMMDRIQAARGKTVGKGKVAKNTKADKYLPA
jgi:hypothetical protein